jgi:hypothetical protein
VNKETLKMTMTLGAQEILSMTPSDRALLFPGPAEEVRRAFKRLATRWHPDVCADPRATEVFAHLVRLRDAALGPKRPVTSITRTLHTRDGRALGLSPLSLVPLDTGELLVGRRSLTWVYRADVSDLAETEARTISGFRFADDKMRAQMSPFLPTLDKRIALTDGGEALVMARHADEVLLADMLRVKGAVPAEHAAWIGSGLLNIACWLGWAGLVHGAISPETVLISPETHTVRLMGGWGFSTSTGARPSALPGRTLALAPRLSVKGEVVDARLDLELIRRTLREALGDPSGASLLRGGAPEPIGRWLVMPPSRSAREDYTDWLSVLERVWGKRRFVRWDLTPETVYA